MSKNPFINQLLQEADTLPDQEGAHTPEPPAADTAPLESAAPGEQTPAGGKEQAPNIQELLQLWQSGEHMGVAAKLMFTESNYTDFVDLVFAIGHAQARELGALLDELADTEGMKPPTTPPEYNELLRRAVGSGSEEKVI